MPGTGEVGENVNIKATDFAALGAFALEESIDMIVVGPEDPLVEGIYDHFQSNPCLKNIAIIGRRKKEPGWKAVRSSRKNSCTATTYRQPATKA